MILGEGDGCWECCISIKLYDQPSPDFDSILFMLRCIRVVCYFEMLQCVLVPTEKMTIDQCVVCILDNKLLSALYRLYCCRDEVFHYTHQRTLDGKNNDWWGVLFVLHWYSLSFVLLREKITWYFHMTSNYSL